MKVMSMFGKRCIVYGYMTADGKYLKRTRIASTASISDKKKLKIGDNVWINHYVRIDTTGGVDIGEGCQIGYGSCILTHSSHISIRLCGLDYMNCNPDERIGYVFKPVRIGAYSFIAGGCYIMPGVTIGKGCVIGVNSVVTKNVPDYSIVVGSPARIVGSTLDIDKKFINIQSVEQNYYDLDVLKKIKENIDEKTV